MILPELREGAYNPGITGEERALIQQNNIAIISDGFPQLLTRMRTTPGEDQSIPLKGLRLIGSTSEDRLRLTYHAPTKGITETSFSVTIDHEELQTPIGRYAFSLVEDNNCVRISATVAVEPSAQGNGYGTALLMHDTRMLNSFLIAHGYHLRNTTIYVSIIDGADAYYGLEAINPYYSREHWTSRRVREYLLGYYDTDREVVQRYATSPIVSAVYVIKDPSMGIDNLSQHC